MVSNPWEELLLGNAVERRLRPGENHPGNRGQGGPKNFVFTGRKGIFANDFQSFPIGLDDVGLPAFVLDVITSAGNEGRTGKSPFQPIDPECFAISGVVAGDDSAHACYQDESVYRGRRREIPTAVAFGMPFHVRLGQISTTGRIDGIKVTRFSVDHEDQFAVVERNG